jgi:hypothetical protein
MPMSECVLRENCKIVTENFGAAEKAGKAERETLSYEDGRLVTGKISHQRSFES